jgi:ribosomal protein L37AE/L43A
MTSELDKKLCEKYPKIFANRHGDMRSTAMCWGFDCLDGWYAIIDRLCRNLQFNTDNNNRPDKEGICHYPQVVASQVKEKYGGLRFYTEGVSMNQHAVISFVESLSYHVCEQCGSMKDVGQTSGWVCTLCRECAKGNEYWKSHEEREQEELEESKNEQSTDTSEDLGDITEDVDNEIEYKDETI